MSSNDKEKDEKAWKASLGLLGRTTGRNVKIHFQPLTEGQGADVVYKPVYSVVEKRTTGGIIGRKKDERTSANKLSIEANDELKKVETQLASRAYNYREGAQTKVVVPHVQYGYSFGRAKTGREVALLHQLTREQRDAIKERRERQRFEMNRQAERDKRHELNQRKAKIKKMTGLSKAVGREAPTPFLATINPLVIGEQSAAAMSPNASSPKSASLRGIRLKEVPEDTKQPVAPPVAVDTFGEDSDSGSISTTQTERENQAKQDYLTTRQQAAKLKGPDFGSTAMRDNSSFFRRDTAAPDKVYQVNLSQQTLNVHGGTWAKMSGRGTSVPKFSVCVRDITDAYEKKAQKRKNPDEEQQDKRKYPAAGPSTLKPSVPNFKPITKINHQKMMCFTDRWKTQNPKAKLPPLVILRKFEAELEKQEGVAVH